MEVPQSDETGELGPAEVVRREGGGRALGHRDRRETRARLRDEALLLDKENVKALFRRGQAHLLRPDHINGLALALEDLGRAAQLEPDEE